MAARAILIAIENYPDAQGIDAQLPGTIAGATAFQQWLMQKKKLAAANITFLKDPARKAVERAFRDLVDSGRDDTEELYVFFSGHGFSFSDSPTRRRPADILVGGGFENLQDSGDECIKLDELQDRLFNAMGPGDHYYFLDACRNPVALADASPGAIAWTRPRSNLGEPTIYTLYSAERQSVTLANNEFPAQLIEGLAGQGKAKRRVENRLVVTFDSLCEYLRRIRARKIDFNRAGSGTGEILRIQPIPKYNCAVEIDNAGAADSFTLVLENGLEQAVGAPVSFTGPKMQVTQPPDDYYLKITHPSATVEPVEDNHADLYDNCTVKFKMIGASRGGPPRPAMARPVASAVRVRGADGATLHIENLQTGAVVEGGAEYSGSMAPGTYMAKIVDASGRMVRSEGFEVTAGQALKLDVGSRKPSTARDGLLSAIPGVHDAARVDLSESLGGPIPDDDLALWLSLIGTSRIVKDPDSFSKLKRLPLATFDQMKAGQSGVYVLAGLENTRQVRVSVSTGPKAKWESVSPVRGLPGIFQYSETGKPGSRLISLKVGNQSAFTVASYCLPNRVTLFVCAQSEDGPLGIHQYLLPAGHLVNSLSPAEQSFFETPPLRRVQYIAAAQKQMAARQKMQPAKGDAAATWDALLQGKWLDPLMAVMASYELAGRKLPVVALKNLTEYFGALPDVAAIRKLDGKKVTAPKDPPLFLSGVRAFPDMKLPLPANRLSYEGPWTMWVGAV